MSEMITTNAVAERLGVTNRTVINWIKSGKLTAYKFGQSYQIEKSEFEKFIEKSKVNGGKENE